MTQFVMMNPEKLREKMAEQKDAEQDQTSWVSCYVSTIAHRFEMVF